MKVKKLIEEGKLGKAIDESMLTFSNENDFVILKGRYNKNESSKNKGIISTENYNVERINISCYLLQLIDKENTNPLAEDEHKHNNEVKDKTYIPAALLTYFHQLTLSKQKISILLFIFTTFLMLFYFRNQITKLSDLNGILFFPFLIAIGIILKLLFYFARNKDPFKNRKINKYYTNLKSKKLNDYEKNFIRDSIKYNKIENHNSQPLVIERKHLMYKKHWRNWAFSIVILMKNKLVISKKHDKFTLEVDLTGENLGIYNNKGKKYLISRLLARDDKMNEFKTANNKIDKLFFSSNTHEDLNLLIHPLRWASGGILPIVTWKNKKWFCLFFRDIPPIGWNIANGASEDKEEYKDLNKLIYREFSEEVIVVNKKPNAGIVKQIKFYHKDFPDSEKFRAFDNQQYSKMYRKRRLDSDGINIENGTQRTEERPVKVIDTPFDVNVLYHDKNNNTRKNKVENIIFNINPFELGIEVCKLISFNLNEEEVIIDGEIMELDEILVRRPVLLLSIDKLKFIFSQNNGSLGTFNNASSPVKEQRDCKYLQSLTKDDYHMFTYDFEMKKNKLSQFSDHGHESKFIKSWMDHYAKDFDDLANNKNIINPINEDVLSFCPVTWKCIESIFKYNIPH